MEKKFVKDLVDPIMKYITKVHWTERLWIVITIIFGVSLFGSGEHSVFQELSIQTSLFYLWCIWGALTVVFQTASAIIISVAQWYRNKKAPISIKNRCPACDMELDMHYTCPKCGKEIESG